MSRLRKVPEGKITKSILRMRKKVRGNLSLRSVFEAVETMEGVYVNRAAITSRLDRLGWIKNVDGVDVLLERRVQ